MKYFLTCVVVVVAIAACNGQVQVPTGGAGVDSLARAQIIALQTTVSGHTSSISTLIARPTYAPNGDTSSYLSGANSWMRNVAIQTGRASFVGTNWRLAIYIPGITAAWAATVSPVYSTSTPAIDFCVRQIKADSLIVLRQANGTTNLQVEYIAIEP